MYLVSKEIICVPNRLSFFPDWKEYSTQTGELGCASYSMGILFPASVVRRRNERRAMKAVDIKT
jgi:hypothetical protein